MPLAAFLCTFPSAALPAAPRSASSRTRRALCRLACCCLLLLAGNAGAARQVIDMAGRAVTLPDQVRRVYAVGHCIPAVGAVAPDLLVATYRLPEAARRLLGSELYAGKAVPEAGLRFSDEEVVRLAPDLIVMEDAPGAAVQAARLEQRLHVPVLLIDQGLPRLKAAFALLGEVFGRSAQAARLSDFIVRHVEPVAARARGIPEARRVRVYYAEGADGLQTNPAGSSHTEVLDYVGGINAAQVASVAGEDTAKVTLEQLYLWQPQLILVWTPGAESSTTLRAIVGNPLWQRLDAVRDGRVVQLPWLPFSWFDRPPGSNRLLGVLWLVQRLYPEVFDFDLVALTREYFALFYHYPLSAAEARRLTAGQP